MRHSHPATRRCSAGTRLWFTIGSLCLALTPVSLHAQSEYSHRVLIIYDQSDRLAPISSFDVAVRNTLDRSPHETYFYREFLDNEIPGNDVTGNAAFNQEFRHWLRQKYSPEKLDLVIAFGGVPAEPLPGVPTIYVGQPPQMGGGAAGAFLPILSGDEASKTLELALRLNPTAKYLVLITGASQPDRTFSQFVRQQLKPFEGRLQIQDLSAQTVPEMSRTLSAMPKDTIILMLSVREDAAGRHYNSASLVDFLSPLAPAPIYSVVDTYMGHGIVGGYSIDFQQLGEAAGRVGLAVFAGTPARSIKLASSTGHAWMFDSRQLRRWGISESSLPAGSKVLYRETSLWSRYRWLIVLAATLLLLQMGLIFALLVHRHRLQNSQAYAEKLTHQLLQSQEEERRRIARELHDGSAQDMFAIKLGLTRLKSKAEVNGTSQEAVDELLQVSESALRNVRSISYLLHPPLLERGGLAPAVKWLVEGFKKRSEMNVLLEIPDSLPRLSGPAETALFRVIQEGLSNALRHSGSASAVVHIREQQKHLILEIRDDGHGFDMGTNGDAASPGVGLASMRERVRELGGDLTVDSSEKGTTVRAMVPLSRVVAFAAN